MTEDHSSKGWISRVAETVQRHPLAVLLLAIGAILGSVTSIVAATTSIIEYMQRPSPDETFSADYRNIQALEVGANRSFFIDRLGQPTFSTTIGPEDQLPFESEKYGVGAREEEIIEDLYVRPDFRVYSLSIDDGEVILYGVWSCHNSDFQPQMPVLYGERLNSIFLEGKFLHRPIFRHHSGNMISGKFLFSVYPELWRQGDKVRGFGQWPLCTPLNHKMTTDDFAILGQSRGPAEVDLQPGQERRTWDGEPIDRDSLEEFASRVRVNAAFRSEDSETLVYAILRISDSFDGGTGGPPRN